MKKMLINEDEKSKILEKHVDFKKVLQESLESLNRGLVQEQLATGVVTDPILNGAEAAGCISGGRIIMYGGKPAYVKIATKASPGRYDVNDRIVVYNNYTYDVISSKLTKKGTFNWNCSGINKSAEEKQSQSITQLKDEFKKKKGAQEYSELEFKTEADNPSFYKKIPFKGVDTGFLYIPNKDREFLATDEKTYDEKTPQGEILKALKDKGYILNPTPLQKTSFRKIKFENEELGGLFPNGLIAYIDPKNLFAKQATDGSVLDATTSVINTKECKEYINQYWENYRDDITGTEIEFNKLKAQVMACKRRYYPNRWGLLGIAGNQIDKKIDVLSRKRNEFDGLTTPSRTSKWLLN
jgi:hypothetical protein